MNGLIIKGILICGSAGAAPASWYLLRQQGSKFDLLKPKEAKELLTEEEYKDILGPILETGFFRNVGDITNWEKDKNCTFRFVRDASKKLGGNAESKMFTYEEKREMLESLNKYHESGNPKRWCEGSGKRKLIRFTRDEKGFWWARLSSS